MYFFNEKEKSDTKQNRLFIMSLKFTVIVFLLFSFLFFLILLNIKTTYQIINDIYMLGKKENIDEAFF